MKKFFISIILLTTLLCSVLGLTACGKEQDVTDKELLSSLVTEESGEYEINLSMKLGTASQYNVTAYLSTADGLCADVFAQNYSKDSETGAISNKGAALFFRDGNLYVDPYGIDIKTNDYVSALKEQLNGLDLSVNGNIFVALDDLFDDALGDILEEIFGLEKDLDITYDRFVETVLNNEQNKKTFKTLAVNFLSYVSEVKTVDDGYEVIINLNDFIEKLEEKIVSVAEYIDNNSDVTVQELYVSQPMKDLLGPLVEDITGKQIENLFKSFVSLADDQTLNLADKIYVAGDENAYDYLGKYLNKKVTGLTIGTIKVEDLVGKIVGDDNYVLPVLKTEVEKLFAAAKQSIKGIFPENFVITISFDKDKKFVECNTELKINVTDDDDESVYYEYDYRFKIQKANGKLSFANLRTNESVITATNALQDYVNLKNLYDKYSSKTYDEYEELLIKAIGEKYDGKRYVRVLLEDTYLKSNLSAEKPVLRVGINAENSPFEYYEGQELKGFDIDLIKEIANDLNIEVEFIESDFDELLANVEEGNCDIVISAITQTDGRNEYGIASNVYYSTSEEGYVIYCNGYLDKLVVAINESLNNLQNNGFIGGLLTKYSLK